MPDNTLVFPPGFRLLDADGNVVSGGSVEFYNAGTSNARTVYSDSGLSTSLGTIVYLDSGGYPVSASGGSNKVSVYTGTSAYKVIIKTSAGATLATIDNLSGALDTSTFVVTSAAPDRPVVSRATSSWTVSGDASASGTIYKSNPTSGSQTVTLPSAITAGDGFSFTLTHDGAGSSNTVTWQTVSSQTVTGNGAASRSSGALTQYGATATFVSDGANWTIVENAPGFLQATVPHFIIADQLTTPPTSPTAGARYIINGSPSGTWSASGFVQHDVVEANGTGGWIRYTPATDCGWTAYVQDEDLNYQFRGTAWVALSGEIIPQQKQGFALYEHVLAQNTTSGTATPNTWDTVPINTETYDTIGCSLSSNVITLPPGTYYIRSNRMIGTTGSGGILARKRLFNVTASSVIAYGSQARIAEGGTVGFTTLEVNAVVTFSVTTSIRFEVFATSTPSWGQILNTSGITENYGQVIISDLAAVKGDQGPQGPSYAIEYLFDSATADADPGAGELRFNNATLASVTTLYVSKTGRNNYDLGTWIGTWDDGGSSGNRGLLTIRDLSDPTSLMLLQVTGTLTDATTYWKVPVTVRASAGTFTNGDSVSLWFSATGDSGSISGTMGATANIIPRTSGTGGTTLQSSGVSAGTTGNDLSWPGRTIQPWVSLTVANGTNNDVALPEGTAYRITAPTGIFTITGLTGGVDGRVVEIYNTVAFAMTIANESASSTAANRITTLTGADVSTTTQGIIRLRYDGTASRWINLGSQA